MTKETWTHAKVAWFSTVATSLLVGGHVGFFLNVVLVVLGVLGGGVVGWWVWGRRSVRYLSDGRPRSATCLGSRYLGDPLRSKLITGHPCARTAHPDCDAGYCDECCKARCSDQCPAQSRFAIKITRKTGEPR